MSGSTLLTDPQVLADLLAALAGDDLPAARRATTAQAVRQARRPTVTWARPAPGRHVIDGTVVDSDLIGLRLAHVAIGAAWRRSAPVADHVAQGSAHPDVAARAALKRAAAFIAPLHAGLAAELARIRVLGGFAVYRPSGRLDVEIG